MIGTRQAQPSVLLSPRLGGSSGRREPAPRVPAWYRGLRRNKDLTGPPGRTWPPDDTNLRANHCDGKIRPTGLLACHTIKPFDVGAGNIPWWRTTRKWTGRCGSINTRLPAAGKAELDCEYDAKKQACKKKVDDTLHAILDAYEECWKSKQESDTPAQDRESPGGSDMSQSGNNLRVA